MGPDRISGGDKDSYIDRIVISAMEQGTWN